MNTWEYQVQSPWQRRVRRRVGCAGSIPHTFREEFDTRIDENKGLDLHTKLSAIKVSQSVVSLVSRTLKGEKEKKIFVCSGTIIGCKLGEEDGLFTHTILTSASLLITRASSEGIGPPMAPEPGIKVRVLVLGGDSFEGEIFCFNFHYNIAVIKFKSKKCFPTAILKSIDGSIHLTPKTKTYDHKLPDSTTSSFGLPPHSIPSNLFNLCPGDKVLALGRHYLSHGLMVAPGAICSTVGSRYLDCVEILKASCKITISGMGGPLINCNGEVIGINFYEGCDTFFLPINIVSRCLDCWENNRRVPQPWFGVKVVSLNAITANKLEKIIQKLGNISGGVLVEEVISESPAYSSGIHPNDIIVQCGRQIVSSSSEFYGTLLENVGELTELTVARPSLGRNLNITTKVIDETSPDICNRWPLPDCAH